MVVPFTLESSISYFTTEIHTKSINITAMYRKDSGFKT